MYIENIPNRNSPPAILLRESYREDGKVKKRTLCNLSKLPAEMVMQIKVWVKASQNGGATIEPGGKVDPDKMRITQSLSYGHIAAVLGTMKKIDFSKLLGVKTHESKIIEAMIAARILNPGSKLACSRQLQDGQSLQLLRDELNLGPVDQEDLYAALKWLGTKQKYIEKRLAKKHLGDGDQLFYDLSSSYVEGEKCPLAEFGYSRDGKKAKKQINYGLLCNEAGLPIKISVFKGNVSDPNTVAEQVKGIQDEFKLNDITLVGDRGMLTQKRIDEDLKPHGIDWISALSAPQIKKLVEDKSIQPALFDERNLAELKHSDYPEERLVVCLNPYLRERRQHNRNSLIAKTKEKLALVLEATQRKKRALKDRDKIIIRAEKAKNAHKVGKLFNVEISAAGVLKYEVNEEKFRKEVTTDGLYVVRTSKVNPDELSAEQAVLTYKNLSKVEDSFRCFKGDDLKVRPIFHYLEESVRAHMLLCMLSYYVLWHVKEALRPLLFCEDDPVAAQATRECVADAIGKSASAKKKADSKHTPEGQLVHSFQTLLENLKGICKSQIEFDTGDNALPINKITELTAYQEKVFELLAIPSP